MEQPGPEVVVMTGLPAVSLFTWAVHITNLKTDRLFLFVWRNGAYCEQCEWTTLCPIAFCIIQFYFQYIFYISQFSFTHRMLIQGGHID